MIHHGNYRTEIERVEAGSVSCVITSPPFWTTHGGQEWGGESNAQTYITRFVRLGTALRGVLQPDGRYWLVLGSRVSWATLHALGEVDWHVARTSSWEDCVVAQLHRSSKAQPLEALDPYEAVITDQPYMPLARRFVRHCLQTAEGS